MLIINIYIMLMFKFCSKLVCWVTSGSYMHKSIARYAILFSRFCNMQHHLLLISFFSAVQHIEKFHNETYPNPDSSFNSRNRRSVPCEVGARRVRRSCVLIRPPPPKPTDSPSGKLQILVADNLGFDGEYFFPNQTPNYNLTMFESSCIFWDVANETWKGDGCRVSCLIIDQD